MNIQIKSKDITSNQEWAADPDMIAFTINEAFIIKAEKALKFLNDNGFENVCDTLCRFKYEFFESTDCVSDEELENSKVVNDEQGNEYLDFIPEYRITGCKAKIFSDGLIRAVFPIKDSPEELWCDIADINHLRAILEAEKLVESISNTTVTPTIVSKRSTV